MPFVSQSCYVKLESRALYGQGSLCHSNILFVHHALCVTRCTRDKGHHRPIRQWHVEMVLGVRLTCSRAWLACSYFAEAQLCEPDFTHQNQTQVNSYCLDCFHVLVSSLTFVIGNFHKCSERIHSTTHHCCSSALKAISLQQKSNVQRKGKQIQYTQKRRKTGNGKTPGSGQPVVKSIAWLLYTC